MPDDYFYAGDMSGSAAKDPFAAYQEAAKVMSAKKESSSGTASGDEVMITGSRRSTVVKLTPSSSLPGKKPKSNGITTRSAQQSADMACSVGSLATADMDGTVLPIGDPSEVVQFLQGGLLRVSSSHVCFPFYSCSMTGICFLCRPFLSCTILGNDCPIKACRSFEKRSRT